VVFLAIAPDVRNDLVDAQAQGAMGSKALEDLPVPFRAELALQELAEVRLHGLSPGSGTRRERVTNLFPDILDL
jgi:hypothetical protein